jgi:hypothetical protein
VDAFRFVHMGSDCDEHAGELVSLRVQADFSNVDQDFLDEIAEAFPFARVMGVSRGSVIVDLELLEEPSEKMIQAAAEAVCTRVNAGPECSSAPEFRRAVPPPDSDKPEPAPKMSKKSGYGGSLLMGVGCVLLALLILPALVMMRKMFAKTVTTSRPTVQVKEVGSPAVEEQKPVPAEFDDNASTATPDSLETQSVV